MIRIFIFLLLCCTSLYTPVYLCIHQYIFVYTSISMYTSVYLCVSLYTVYVTCIPFKSLFNYLYNYTGSIYPLTKHTKNYCYKS